MKKNYLCKLKISYLLGIIIFFIFNIAYAIETQIQEVYLASEPLPKIVTRLKKQGLSQQQIFKHLKSTLPMITPELAKEKFGIRWINNVQPREHLLKQIEHLFKHGKEIILSYEKLYNHAVTFNNPARYLDNIKDKYANNRYSPKIYPSLVISYVNEEVGYGLFALEPIESGDIIAEYSGIIYERQGGFSAVDGMERYSVVKDSNGKENPFCGYYAIGTRFEGVHIEACRAGNAARFASSLPLDEDLFNYTQKIIQEKKTLCQHQIFIKDFLCSNSTFVAGIATANAIIFFSICDCKEDKCETYPKTCDEPHIPRTFLVAIKKIDSFEQIGFSYFDMEDGFLFDKNGNTITYENYKKMVLDSLNKN